MPGSFLLSRIVSVIARAVGPQWDVVLSSSNSAVEDTQAGAVLELRPPNGATVRLAVLTLTSAYPRDVIMWLRNHPEGVLAGTHLLVSLYLSPRARALLEEANVNYADATGNLRLLVIDPPIVVRDRGVDRKPATGVAAAMTLRGARATRVLRLLCDVMPPHGVRDLAAKAQVSPGYVSKLLRLLESEAIVERDPRGAVAGVDWPGLLQRWSHDYRTAKLADCEPFSSPRGPVAVLRGLSTLGLRAADLRYAVTGAFAAARAVEACEPPSGALTCYADAPLDLADAAGLVRGGRSADVWLCEPRDPIVFQGSWESGGVRFAAPSQVVVDCIGGLESTPGAAADGLIEWMRANEGSWRTAARQEG
jgi:hypothetical protein